MVVSARVDDFEEKFIRRWPLARKAVATRSRSASAEVVRRRADGSRELPCQEVSLSLSCRNKRWDRDTGK